MNEQVEKCIKILKNGGVILYPTDTIWGLGCDATNEEAVKKIYQIKQREDSKSLITIVSSDTMLQKYVDEVPEIAWDLLDLATKPTTIIYDNARLLASNTIADDGSIGIRMIKEGFCNKLVHKFNKPIVSTSANISGNPSPIKFSDIEEEIKSNVDCIIDPSLDNGAAIASSIIKLKNNGEITIIRK